MSTNFIYVQKEIVYVNKGIWKVSMQVILTWMDKQTPSFLLYIHLFYKILLICKKILFLVITTIVLCNSILQIQAPFTSINSTHIL